MVIRKSLKLLMIFNFLIVFCARGQAYHKLLGNHQIWEQYQGDATVFCTLQSGQIIFEGNDTIIQGLKYKNLLGYHLYSNTSMCFTFPFFINDTVFNGAILREDTSQKKVFIYDKLNNTEFLLYDFSASDGDTLVNPFFENFQPSPFYFIVDSVRPINISSVGLRNCFYINIPGSSGQYFYIESIGGIDGIDQSGAEAIGEVKILQCVKDSSYNSIYGNCFCNVGIEENANSDISVSISPNPTHDFCTVNSKSDEIKNSIVFDIAGKVIKTQIEKKIDLTEFANGIYFIEINFKNEKRGYCKVIKE